MKKLIALMMVLSLMTVMVACGEEKKDADPTKAPTPTEAAQDTPTPEATPEATPTPDVAEDIFAKSEGVMTYAEYAAAELESEVVVETFVQAKQGWWDNKATVYTQDNEGAYFLYNMPCSEEDYAKLVPGTKIRVKGYKAEWSGEVEIIDAEYEILEGSYVAEAVDVTELLGTDDLVAKQNMFVSFTGLTVAGITDADGNIVPFIYNWDGSGEEGSDLYFNVSLGDATYQFLVESYLCGADTEVYKAVKALEVGQTVDMQGFLYWYNGVNPHITSVTVK